MLIVIAISILIILPMIMTVVNLFRPNFAFHWPLALLGALTAWIMILASRATEPRFIPLLRWQPETIFPTSPTLIVDPIAWVYAVGLLTLSLAVLLTAVVRRPQTGWRSWAGTMVLAGFGLLAVFAGNLLTLMMSWAAIDILEAWILFSWIRRSEARTRFLIALSTRVFGIAFLIWAEIVTRAGGEVLSFASIPADASIYLVLAAGLRLGVLPLQSPFLQDHPLRRGLGTLLRMVPVAASLVLLARAAGSPIPPLLAPYLLLLASLAAIYSAISWMTASSELGGRPYWILGMTSMAVVAAVRMEPGASLAWGMACLLSGGILFMYSVRSKYLLPILLLGVFALTSIPLTPTWAGVTIYRLSSNTSAFYFILAINFILLLSQLALVLGYLRQALHTVEMPTGLERWVWIFYPPGLGLMMVMEYYLGWQIWKEWNENPGPIGLLGGVVLIVTVSMWFLLYKSGRFLSMRRTSKGLATWGSSVWGRILSLQWLYRLIWILYHLFSRIIAWLTGILEGEAGILWALVFLFLLFSLTIPGR